MRQKTKRSLIRRLKIIEGQVRGFQKMIEDEKYCIDVITQSSAIRHSIGSIEDLLLEEHLNTCVRKQMTGKNFKKATKEVMDVYKLAKKK